MDKKENKTFIAFSIMLLILIINIAYAYFTSMQNIKNANIEVTTGTNLPVFTATANGNLELSVTADDQTAPSTTAVKTDDAEILVTLTSYENNKSTSCKYSIYYNYTKDVDERNYSLPYNSEYNYELSIKGSRINNDTTSGHTYLNKNLQETDLSNFTDVSEGKILLINEAEIYSSSVETASTTRWTFTMSYYVLPIEQAIHSYGGYLSVEDVTCL